MKRHIGGVTVALGLALGLGAAGANGQSTPDTVASHVAAAEAAGRELWPSLLDRLCSAADERPPDQTATRIPQQAESPPSRSDWYRVPEQVFDNVYLFATRDTSETHGLLGVEVAAWAVTGSNGIVPTTPVERHPRALMACSTASWRERQGRSLSQGCSDASEKSGDVSSVDRFPS